jgi:hypothetical protein
MGRLFIATLVAALFSVPASSAGTSPLTLSPSVITLGHVRIGTTTEAPVTLTNTGSDALTLNSYEAFGYNGNFTIDPGSCTLGTTLAGGESCTFSVLTSPSIVGAIRGQFCYTGVSETTSDRVCGRVTGGAS